MANAPRKSPATYDDVLAAPENMVAEIVDGELTLHPRPAPRHARAASTLGAALTLPFDFGDGGPGGWIILDEPELHLLGKHEPLVPDLAGWRRERMSSLPETAYFELAPDWVCEVLSPGTASHDRIKKMPRYARACVGHAWLIDPDARSLEVYRREAEAWLYVAGFEGDAVVRAEPFEAVEIDLGRLFVL